MRCSTIELLNILGKRWDATILEEINDLKKTSFDKLLAINKRIYPKTLSKALKDLVDSGLIKKELIVENKIKHSNYSITDNGIDLLTTFQNFKKMKCGGSKEDFKRCRTCEYGPNSAITIK